MTYILSTELYRALLYNYNSNAAQYIIDSYENAIREKDGDFEYCEKRWIASKEEIFNNKQFSDKDISWKMSAAFVDFLFCSFDWSSSPQGFDFWRLVYKQVGVPVTEFN